MSVGFKLTSCRVNSSHLKRPITKNIENTINHILCNQLSFIPPSDRTLEFEIEGWVDNKNLLSYVLFIHPVYVDGTHKVKNTLHKELQIKGQVPLDDLQTQLYKTVEWTLNYFGFTICYVQKYFRTIVIETVGKGLTLEYLS